MFWKIPNSFKAYMECQGTTFILSSQTDNFIGCNKAACQQSTGALTLWGKATGDEGEFADRFQFKLPSCSDPAGVVSSLFPFTAIQQALTESLLHGQQYIQLGIIRENKKEYKIQFRPLGHANNI